MRYLFQVLLGFTLPLLVAWLVSRIGGFPVRSRSYLRSWMVSAAGGVIGALLPPGSSAEATGSAASCLLALILWWWSRRKRKKTIAALGGRARARLAAMIKNMPKPGPVLQPVPQ
jgi:hypothetical protein